MDTIVFEVFMVGTPGQAGFKIGFKCVSPMTANAARDMVYAHHTFEQARASGRATMEGLVHRVLEWWGKKGSTVTHSLVVTVNRGRTGAPMKDWNRLRVQRKMERKARELREAVKAVYGPEMGLLMPKTVVT